MKRALILGALAVLTIVAVVASVVFGARDVPLDAVFAALSGDSSTVDAAAAYTRIPRTIMGALVGASLAVSGLTMQGITRNPLADPGILGILQGASLAVVLGIAFAGLGTEGPATIAVASVGAGLAACFVYAIASLGRGGATPLKLALAGAATTAAASSLVGAVLLPRSEVLETFRLWQIGSLGGSQWSSLAYGIPVIAVGLLMCWMGASGLNSLSLGDDVASSLGTNVTAMRIFLATGAVILAGSSTALVGPITFVGLVVPHMLRYLAGNDYRFLVPATALGGAAVLLLSDVVARVIARPYDLAVGVVMPLIGAPVFMWIIRSQRVREL